MNISNDGSTIVVGAYNEASGGGDRGMAYVFERQADGTYTQVARLQPTALNNDAESAFNIDISANGIMLGGPKDEEGVPKDCRIANNHVHDTPSSKNDVNAANTMCRSASDDSPRLR